ncbi:MAG: winged helix-turn-helix domain-containing protein [Chloroflexi bacterium]|nr:winged helix-turn-helix domain-containing protein [Chloroflexota bacterium]
MHGLWLLRDGWRLGEVSEVVGVHYRTVQRWVAWYRVGGLAAVQAHKMGGTGQAPFLTSAQEAEVAAAVATGRFRTGEELRAWIAERFGVAYTVGGVYSLLERLRCRPKVPRPMHAKADRAAQEAWKKGGFSKRLVRRA